MSSCLLTPSSEEDKSPLDSSPTPDRLEWHLVQVKGKYQFEINEADLITCLQFNSDGQYLATGDKSGRIVIFKRNPQFDKTSGRQYLDYNVHVTFTSHEAEFDYLKSLEIEEKINKIKWLSQTHRNSQYLLSTNDKTIKLWRVSERPLQQEPCLNFHGSLANATLAEKLTHINTQGFVKVPRYCVTRPSSATQLDHPMGDSENMAPLTSRVSTRVESVAKQVYANAHAYHINSISVNSDQETFLSSDDLRINIWNLNCTNESFNVVDMKPANMEDLTEVITAAEFHPSACALFVYSSSKGTLRVCDMRQNALCDKHALMFEVLDNPADKSFFSEIISSVSDVHFSHSGNYILSRDYLNLKVWDMRMPRDSVENYPVHPYLRNKLCALYENDCIFDKFECCWSPDDKFVMTGTYNNLFRVFDRHSKAGVTLDVSREGLRGGTETLLERQIVNTPSSKPNETSVDRLDFKRKLLHLAWHPTEHITAMATSTNLVLLSANSAGGMKKSASSGDSCPDEPRPNFQLSTKPQQQQPLTPLLKVDQ